MKDSVNLLKNAKSVDQVINDFRCPSIAGRGAAQFLQGRLGTGKMKTSGVLKPLSLLHHDEVPLRISWAKLEEIKFQ